MKRASLLLAAALVAGTASVTVMAPAADAKKSSQDSSLIHKGMTLDQVEQAAGGAATPAGAPRNDVQTYRISIRQDGDGGTNDHPIVTVYTFGLKDGKVTWVHKQK